MRRHIQPALLCAFLLGISAVACAPSAGEPPSSGSSMPNTRSDNSKSRPRSSGGAPTSSQITCIGNGAAMSAAKSACPRILLVRRPCRVLADRLLTPWPSARAAQPRGHLPGFFDGISSAACDT